MDPRIEAAVRLIGQEYAQKLAVTSLAVQAGLSRSRFEHLFKQETGLTPKSYLRQTRLSAAKNLLGNWTLSVKQVAAQVGYTHAPDFSRDFRERFGISPSRYRRETAPPRGKPGIIQ